MNWIMDQTAEAQVAIIAGAGLLLAGLALVVLERTWSRHWRAEDPGVHRRPAELQPWHVDPVTDRTAFVRDVDPARRSLDPEWRERILEAQPSAPARHRAEHHEETRAWDPEDLRRRIQARGEELDRG